MAFNLTYDPSDDPMALEEAEARDTESLEIGERLAQEQEALLAGKYRDAEELERAYLELQSKFSQRGQEPEAEEPEEVAKEEEEVIEEGDYSFLNRLAEESDSGQFSDETLKALEGMSAADIADMFLSYRQNVEPVNESYALDETDVSELKGIAGGEEQYNSMMAWAAQNLSPEEIQVYDQVMDRGDPQAIYFAIQALSYRFNDSVGYEGQLLTGTASRSVDAFRSQAEVVRAMSDPRYENDPAYRQDVYDKLERSNLNY
jgi:hypothetical protein